MHTNIWLILKFSIGSGIIQDYHVFPFSTTFSVGRQTDCYIFNPLIFYNKIYLLILGTANDLYSGVLLIGYSLGAPLNQGTSRRFIIYMYIVNVVNNWKIFALKDLKVSIWSCLDLLFAPPRAFYRRLLRARLVQ